MNLFFSIFILTIFFYSLRFIDSIKYKKLKGTISKEDEKFLKEVGFFKDES